MAGYVQLLRSNPGFARLWLAQVVSLMGDWFNLIVLSALVAEYSGGSGPAVSLLVVARVLPPFLISPVAGVLADRFDRRRLLIVSDLARAGVVLAYLLATGPEALWLIYALTVLQFSLSAIFWPAQSALIPSLIPHSDLVRANTLGSITWSVMLAVGAVLGGLVASLVGPVAALVTDAATFVVSALFIGAIRAPHYVAETAPDAATPPAAPAGAPSDRGLREGLRYALAHPTTTATLLVKAGLGIVSADTLIVIYGTDVFRLGKDGTGSIGILYATYGVGAVLGPLLFNRVNDGSVRVMRRLIAGGFVVVTAGWGLLSGAPSLVVVALAFLLRAMGGSVNWTYSSVILQARVADAYLGRIFSFDNAANQLATVVGTVVTGAMIQAVGTAQIHIVALVAALTSVVPLAAWVAAVPWMERIDRSRQAAPGGPEALAVPLKRAD